MVNNPLSLQIALVVPGMPFDGSTLKNKSLGGSETAAAYMAKELAALGHKVFVFSNCPAPGEYDGVTYRGIQDFKQFGPVIPHDVTIVQRMPEMFASRFESKLNVLWCHDMAHGRAAGTFNAVTWNVDQVAVLSDYMAQQYKDVYKIPDRLLWRTRNGIDLADVEAARAQLPEGYKRDRKKLMYAARPERGLDVFLKKIFPKLLKNDPELKLYVAGYDNQADHMAGFYRECNDMMKAYGDRCEFVGYLTKRELYKHYLTAGCYVYPTPSPIAPGFNEISCITAMECQAAGLPIITSNRGALSETIAHDAGWLIEAEPGSDQYTDLFVEAVLAVCNDDQTFEAMSAAGEAAGWSLRWRTLAAEWSDHFIAQIQARNDSPARLLEHLYKQSDIIAAEELIARNPELKATKTAQQIADGWAFKNYPGDYQAHYEKIGAGHTDIFDQTAGESRLGLMADWLVKHPEIRNVVDWGCAMGAYAIHLSNVFPDLRIVGVDVDKNSIAMAEGYRQTKALHPGNLQFLTTDEMQTQIDSGQAIKKADGVFLCEVLEHVPDPNTLIEKVENLIKPGGRMLITVPYGPWEYMSYKTYPHRCHMWHFDYHDLQDLFGSKPNYGLMAVPAGVDSIMNTPIGWHMLSYTADHQPTGQINMDRKLSFQKPPQTVSGVIIAGRNAEETLLWSVKSWADHVNEIIVGDTGLSLTAREMLADLGAKVVPASDPLVAGFETPRNEALEHAGSDWIFWIDTDERLLEPQHMQKYLRDNVWNGYGIRQWHFAVDTTFTPDMPVRLFRRVSEHGRCKWYGMIHEHPELELNKGPGPVVVLSDLNIAHVGYLIESGRQGRFWRNKPLLDLDIKTYPARILQKHFICRDNILMAGYMLNAGGGKLNSEIIRLCRDTIAIYREHFMGRPFIVNVDSLQYYTQALQILGEGVDVAFDIQAGKDGQVAQLAPNVARFANIDDFMAEIKSRAESQIQPYLMENW